MDTVYQIFRSVFPFEWAQYTFMIHAFLAVLLVTPLFGLVGTTVVNNRMAFFSDALGHSALTGIAIGVLLGVENHLVSMIGFALVFALAISAVLDSGHSSADTIIGVFSSVGLALGVVILSAQGGFAKYSAYLIGDILTVQPKEILMIAVLFLIVMLLWAFFYNKLMLTGLSEDMAAGKKIPTRLLKKGLVLLIALLVTVSIKWIGIMIINSLLVLPAAAARNVTHSARSSHFLSMGIALFSGISGLLISYYTGTAASGTIVLVAAACFFLSLGMGKLRKNR